MLRGWRSEHQFQRFLSLTLLMLSGESRMVMSAGALFWIPEGHPAWFPALLLQLAAGVVLYRIERSGLFFLPRRDQKRDRSAGTVLFALITPLVLYLWTYFASDAPTSTYHIVLLIAILILFLRRFLEALWFRRRLAGDRIEVLAAAAGYGAFGLTAGFLHNYMTLPEMVPDWSGSFITAIGLVLFTVGVVLNTTQHRSLAHGRPFRFAIGEVHPWARFVPGPHYLGEILAWLGFAVLSRQVAVYGFAFLIVCLILARSGLGADPSARGREKNLDQSAVDNPV